MVDSMRLISTIYGRRMRPANGQARDALAPLPAQRRIEVTPYAGYGIKREIAEANRIAQKLHANPNGLASRKHRSK